MADVEKRRGRRVEHGSISPRRESEAQAPFGIGIELPPEQPIEQCDEDRHHRHAEDDLGEIPLARRFRDIGADALCGNRLVLPLDIFGDDRGVPGAARRGRGAGGGAWGSAPAPPIVLKTIYHCVPNTIKKLSQMSGSRWKVRIRLTAAPNSRLTGKAARNCAKGCTASAQRGRKPTQTLIGTQTIVAHAMRTTTRSNV